MARSKSSSDKMHPTLGRERTDRVRVRVAPGREGKDHDGSVEPASQMSLQGLGVDKRLLDFAPLLSAYV